MVSCGLRSIAFVVAILPLPSVAQEIEIARHADWQTVRGGDGTCLASATFGLRQADTGLLTVALLPDATSEARAVMTARVPLGAALDTPLAYSWPTGPEATGLAWQSCDSDTCLAMATIDAEEVDRLKRGLRVFFAFRPLPDVAPLIVPVSLIGLTRAWNEAQDCL